MSSDDKINWDVIKLHKKILHIGTLLWIRHIVNRINNNKNFMGIIVGSTGGGKSLAALSLAEILSPEGFDVKCVAFTVKEFLNLIKDPTLKQGSVIIFDEAGLAFGRRDFFSQANKAMLELLQVFRYKNFIVFFTVPDMGFVDSGAIKLFHAKFEMKRILKDERKSVLCAWEIKTNMMSNKGEWYPQCLRYKTKDMQINKSVRTLHLKKPSIALINAYEKKKENYANKIYQDMYDKFVAKDEKQEKLVKYTQKELQVKKLLESDPNLKSSLLAAMLDCKTQWAGKLITLVKDKMDEEKALEEAKKKASKGI